MSIDARTDAPDSSNHFSIGSIVRQRTAGFSAEKPLQIQMASACRIAIHCKRTIQYIAARRCGCDDLGIERDGMIQIKMNVRPKSALAGLVISILGERGMQNRLQGGRRHG